jgi:CubicO group peptidase (beta-lactamase class C family)
MGRLSSVFATALSLCVLTQFGSLPARADTGFALTQALSDRIDEMAKGAVHAGRAPGVAVGIVEDGRIVYARGFGFADLSKHVPMTPDTQFYAGGLTRQFTAAAVLLLVQDGKLALDDHVSKYVPEFRLGTAITIAQLLAQTSGLPQPSRIPGLSADRTHAIKLAGVLAALDEMKLAAEPGTVYADNPINYLLAALIVERASGVPLSDYLEQHVFIPLLMDNTFLAGDSGISAQHAIGYTRTSAGFDPAPTWDPTWLGGDGGLVTTIYDLAKWDIAMPILLRVDAVRTMFAPVSNNGPTRYGMGWVIDRRFGKDFVWSDGDIAGYRAMNALLPEQHVGVIVFSNADSLHVPTTIPEGLGGRILDLIVPSSTAHLSNATIERAREWLTLLASGHIRRDELTPAFSAYLTDDFVARQNLAGLGPLLSIVPVSSTAESNGDTLYEFLVRYRYAQYHYDFEITAQGKIDGIRLIA